MALRAAVLGVGHLGRHHARILSELEGVELVAVVDPDAARGEDVAARYGSHFNLMAGVGQCQIRHSEFFQPQAGRLTI